MSTTVTATQQGASTSNGTYLDVIVVTGALASSSQPGRTATDNSGAGAISITPGGTVQTPSPVHDSVGNFHYDVDTTGAGGTGLPQTAIIQWKGTGTVQAIAVDYFNLVPASL